MDEPNHVDDVAVAVGTNAVAVAVAGAVVAGAVDAIAVVVVAPADIAIAVVSAGYAVAAAVSGVGAVASVALAPRRESAGSTTTPAGTTWPSVARTVAEKDEVEALFQTLRNDHAPREREGGEPGSTGTVGRHGMDDANTVVHGHARLWPSRGPRPPLCSHPWVDLEAWVPRRDTSRPWRDVSCSSGTDDHGHI